LILRGARSRPAIKTIKSLSDQSPRTYGREAARVDKKIESLGNPADDERDDHIGVLLLVMAGVFRLPRPEEF